MSLGAPPACLRQLCPDFEECGECFHYQCRKAHGEVGAAGTRSRRQAGQQWQVQSPAKQHARYAVGLHARPAEWLPCLLMLAHHPLPHLHPPACPAG